MYLLIKYCVSVHQYIEPDVFIFLINLCIPHAAVFFVLRVKNELLTYYFAPRVSLHLPWTRNMDGEQDF